MLEGAKGFTIIELTIFLAISGMLLLMMFFGTGSIVSRQRFTDTTDSLQAFFQSQYDEVTNGVNVSSATTACGGSALAGQSDCLLVGKLLTIRPGENYVQANYIISKPHVSRVTTDPKDELDNANLSVVTDGQILYELKWGARVAWSTRSLLNGTGRDTSSMNSAAFIRLPKSGRIVQLYYRNPDYNDGTNHSDMTNLISGLKGTGSTPGSGILDTNAYSPVPDTTSSSFAVCVKNTNDFLSSSVRSAILFSGQGAGAITTSYQPAGGLQCSAH